MEKIIYIRYILLYVFFKTLVESFFLSFSYIFLCIFRLFAFLYVLIKNFLFSLSLSSFIPLLFTLILAITTLYLLLVLFHVDKKYIYIRKQMALVLCIYISATVKHKMADTNKQTLLIKDGRFWELSVNGNSTQIRSKN